MAHGGDLPCRDSPAGTAEPGAGPEGRGLSGQRSCRWAAGGGGQREETVSPSPSAQTHTGQAAWRLGTVAWQPAAGLVLSAAPWFSLLLIARGSLAQWHQRDPPRPGVGTVTDVHAAVRPVAPTAPGPAKRDSVFLTRHDREVTAVPTFQKKQQRRPALSDLPRTASRQGGAQNPSPSHRTPTRIRRRRLCALSRGA